MYKNERSQDVFEHIEGYQKPPLVPLPDRGDYSSLQEMGLKPGGFSNLVTRVGLGLTGFKSFEDHLPQDLETLLRRSNLRGAGLFSLIVSASLALEDDPRELTPIQRAVTLLFGARDLHDDLWAGNLPQDMYKDHPLEMGQYPNLFSTCLIVDGKRARIYKSKSTQQITVMIGGRIFVLEVGVLGGDTSFGLLAGTLEELVQTVKENPRSPHEPSPGILTCASHAAQLPIFQHLQQNDTNRLSLTLLRDSFLTLCLDLDHHPKDAAEAALIAQSQNLGNRWQHSSLQLVVFGNAKAVALCNFNAYVDGNTMMRGASEIQVRACSIPVESKPVSGLESIILQKELPFEIPPQAMERAMKDIEWVLDEQQATFEIPTGSRHFSSGGVRAVPAFILSLVMTAHKLTGVMANINQFMAMTRYRCMDLVTASMTTPEVARFVEYMAGETPDKREARQLLDRAIESQEQASSKARSKLSYSKILALFIESKQGFGKVFASLMLGLSMLILRLFGSFKQPETDIIVSHPGIYKEVPVVGRPGIRLPYVKYFGLHYQVMPEKTVITMMPAVNWQVPNSELIKELAANLERVLWVISED